VPVPSHFRVRVILEERHALSNLVSTLVSLARPHDACFTVAAGQTAGGAEHEAPAAPLLLSFRLIEQQVNAAVTRSARRRFATLPVRPSTTLVASGEPEDFLGSEDGGQQFDAQLGEAAIEVPTPSGLLEPPLQVQIPLGLAGFASGIRHPTRHGV
jgi:hypothetical protein